MAQRCIRMCMYVCTYACVCVCVCCLQLEIDGRTHARGRRRLGREGECVGRRRDDLELGDGGGRVVERGEETHAHLAADDGHGACELVGLLHVAPVGAERAAERAAAPIEGGLLSQGLVALRRLPAAARWKQPCRLAQHGALRVAEPAPDAPHHAAQLPHQVAAVVATLRERTMPMSMYLAAALAADLTPALALLETLLDPPEGRPVARAPRIASGAAAAIPGVVAQRGVCRGDQPRLLTHKPAGGAAHELGLQRRRRQRWRRLGGCPGEEECDRAGGGGKRGGGFHAHAQVEGVDVQVDWLEELEPGVETPRNRRLFGPPNGHTAASHWALRPRQPPPPHPPTPNPPRRRRHPLGVRSRVRSRVWSRVWSTAPSRERRCS